MRLIKPIRIYAESNRYSAMSGYASAFNGRQSEWVMGSVGVFSEYWYIAKAVPYNDQFPDESPILFIKLCGSKPMSI
jgi:hypothetical protein